MQILKGIFQQAIIDLDLKPFQEMNLVLDFLEGNAKSLVQKIYEACLTRSRWTGLDEESGTVQKDPKGHAQSFKNLDVVFWKSNKRLQSVSKSTTFGF